MPVRIRLSRQGTKNNPFYHVVAIADHKPRDARPIEKLGEYDPIPRALPFIPPRLSPDTPITSSGLPKMGEASTSSAAAGAAGAGGSNAIMQKRLEWNSERIKYWLGVGAQPSKPVARMLDKAGLIPEGKIYKGMQLRTIEDFAKAEEIAQNRKAKKSAARKRRSQVDPSATPNQDATAGLVGGMAATSIGGGDGAGMGNNEGEEEDAI